MTSKTDIQFTRLVACWAWGVNTPSSAEAPAKERWYQCRLSTRLHLKYHAKPYVAESQLRGSKCNLCSLLPGPPPSTALPIFFFIRPTCCFPPHLRAWSCFHHVHKDSHIKSRQRYITVKEKRNKGQRSKRCHLLAMCRQSQMLIPAAQSWEQLCSIFLPPAEAGAGGRRTPLIMSRAWMRGVEETSKFPSKSSIR